MDPSCAFSCRSATPKSFIAVQFAFALFDLGTREYIRISKFVKRFSFSISFDLSFDISPETVTRSSSFVSRFL